MNRHISNRDKVGYDSGRDTQQNSESILTAQRLDGRSDKARWEASALA
jgi:hypothetical protein